MKTTTIITYFFGMRSPGDPSLEPGEEPFTYAKSAVRFDGIHKGPRTSVLVIIDSCSPVP